MLALTFVDSDDYDRILADDRLDLVGLDRLAPGEPVECRINHMNGSSEILWLKHSYSDAHLQWFRAGSALNVLHKSAA